MAPPGGRGWYSPVRVHAVLSDHGFQRVCIGWKRERETKKRVREGCATTKAEGSAIRAALRISER